MSRVTTLLLILVLAPNVDAQGNPSFGEAAYRVCAGCHGFAGEGSRTVDAPALGGLESWYLRRQLQNFAVGIRGGESDDAHGKAMAVMSRMLQSKDDIDNVTAYVAKLPVANDNGAIEGDVESGRQLYATCGTCHGEAGEGSQLLNAPALAGMSDWYQLAQLAKFKSGQRGRHPDDTYGQQMVPMMASLEDEQAMKDVIAYINSLR